MTNHPKNPSKALSKAPSKDKSEPLPGNTTRSVLQSVLAALRQGLAKYRLSRARRKAQKEARDAFMTTLGLDDRMLEDIGVTREEAQWAAGLPLEINAARALHARARRRRRCPAAKPEGTSPSLGISNEDLSAERLIVPLQASMGPQRARPYRLWAPSGRDSRQVV